MGSIDKRRPRQDTILSCNLEIVERRNPVPAALTLNAHGREWSGLIQAEILDCSMSIVELAEAKRVVFEWPDASLFIAMEVIGGRESKVEGQLPITYVQGKVLGVLRRGRMDLAEARQRLLGD